MQLQINQLPVGGAITGTESVPVQQNGLTVQVPASSLAGQPTLTAQFLSVSTTGLPNARYIAVGANLSLTDSGAGNALTISPTGVLAGLGALGNGLVAKTASNTLQQRQITVGTGLSIANGDGISGNPAISLSTLLSNFSATAGTGLLAINGSNFTPVAIQGTANQITVTGGDGSAGSPVIALSSQINLPGASFGIPSGSTANRPASPAVAQMRFNTDTNIVEVYTAVGWQSLGAYTQTRATTRVQSIATATVINPPCDQCDQYDVTALATTTTIDLPTGTPQDGQKLMIRLKSNGSIQTVNYNASVYNPIGQAIPFNLSAVGYSYVGCVYNAQSGLWDIIAVIVS